MSTMLDDLIAQLNELPEEERKAIEEEALRETEGRLWTPNPGPQTEAYFSEADELFYGGSAGGGKSSFLIGLAVEEHEKSIIFRREYPQIKGLEEEAIRIMGSRDGYNSQDKVWKIPNSKKILEFGAVQYEHSKEKYQGRAHDLKGFDELAHFTETQYTFLIGWNRSAKKGQRSRVIAAGNPPTTPEGFWIVKRWAPWLDPTHKNPAKPGELRWFTTIDGKDTEVEGPGPFMIDGREVYARSRTFIPARLEDNPDYMASGYASTLDAMPEPYRTMLREGRFDIGVDDDPLQVIPTEWVRAAQQRWTETPPDNVPMCAMALDPAQGGKDESVLAWRHDGWFAPLVAVPGVDTPSGAETAAMIIKHRRGKPIIIIDMGGGYGGATVEHLKANEIDTVPYKGAGSSSARTADKLLTFYNKRAESWWRFREALDPSQPGGSSIMLPPDSALLADLTAPRMKGEITMRGIQIESKEDIKKRLTRSPDRGDAVVMAWASGATMATHHNQWKSNGSAPKVNLGYANRRRR